MISKHHVFVIHYNQRRSLGNWEDQDTYNHIGWSDPISYKVIYVSSEEEIALAHWNHWKRFSETKDNPKEFVRVEKLGEAKLLLEL